METLLYKGKKIRYQVQGEGETFFLLHGYLESQEIWDSFATELSKYSRIIRIDLPGHGMSDVFGEIHSMEFMADVVKHVLDFEKQETCILIGHSLGGYVTLAFLEKYPQYLKGFSLFHSHPFADTEQVKAKRKKEIELVKQGQKKTVVDANTPKLFADFNLSRFPDDLKKIKQNTLQFPDDGIIANLNGMMQRPARNIILKETDKPFLLIAGKYDNYIDYDKVISQIDLPEKGKLVTLEHSGHLGFIEEREKSLEEIYEFFST
ncbi:MAG: alpha/beta hydrolase [Bacteroidales bacterium]